MSYLWSNTAPIAPCLISVTGDRFINVFDFTPTNYPHYQSNDITRPVQAGHSYLFVGQKGEEYTLTARAFFETPALREAFKLFVAESTSQLYHVYDVFGNVTRNQFLRQVRYTDEKIYYDLNTGSGCYSGSCYLQFDLYMIPN